MNKTILPENCFTQTIYFFKKVFVFNKCHIKDFFFESCRLSKFDHSNIFVYVTPQCKDERNISGG